jgi:putative flippase GtrA
MTKLATSIVSLLVGVLAFAVVGVGVTEALASRIWLSAMIGLPAGIIAGAIATPLTYLGVRYWRERQEMGRASATTRRRLRTLIGATVGFLVGGGLAMAIVSTQAVPLASSMLFAGFPVGLLSALVVGYLTFRRGPSDGGPSGSTPT